MNAQPGTILRSVAAALAIGALFAAPALAQSDEAPAANRQQPAAQVPGAPAASPVAADQLANRCAADVKEGPASLASWTG
jgi:hypothetical protein